MGFGAEEGTRTPTPLRVHGPEPCASANSATSATVVHVPAIEAEHRNRELLVFQKQLPLSILVTTSRLICGEVRLHHLSLGTSGMDEQKDRAVSAAEPAAEKIP